MATRGYENVTLSDLRGKVAGQPAMAKPSKYKNVRTMIDGITFDSRREANHYAQLRMREKAGEISELRCQVPFELFAPIFVAGASDSQAVIARYVADFTYVESGRLIVVDAKGKRTALYQLKRKWLLFQSGITILEI